LKKEWHKNGQKRNNEMIKRRQRGKEKDKLR
jgi:hypothetical protein